MPNHGSEINDVKWILLSFRIRYIQYQPRFDKYCSLTTIVQYVFSIPTDKMHLKLDISVLKVLYTIGIYGNFSRVTAYLVETQRIH